MITYFDAEIKFLVCPSSISGFCVWKSLNVNSNDGEIAFV